MAALLLLGASTVATAQEADAGHPVAEDSALALDEIYTLARGRNPRLQATMALAEARDVSRSWAGLLPDPRFQLGLMNLSLPGLDADMPSSMAPSLQVTQVIPFPGKLGLESEIAARSAEMARADADESWWTVRARAGRTFWELYAIDWRLDVLRDTKRRLEDFELAARAMYEAGTGRQTDVLQAQVEVARISADIARVRATRAGTVARLNALLDRPALTEVPRPAAGQLPSAIPPVDTLRAWAETQRPVVRSDRLAVERADTRVARAGKEVWPDFMVGAAYGQRRLDGDTQRMASFMLGFELPIFAGRRQLRMRDEAVAMADLARAELAETRAAVDARLGELVADLDRSRELIRLYREEVLPQARITVESAFASYRVGAVDFGTLVNAQVTLDRYEDEFHRWVADYGTAVAELESAVGRPLPPAEPIDTEAR
jgi:outer membrane protein TolC